MNSTFTLALSFALLSAVSVVHAAPVQIGDRLQLFVDDTLIDRMKDVQLVLNHPEEKESAFAFEKPWEGQTSAYVTIMKDTDRYRAYYRGSSDRTGQAEVTCTAESVDGIHWTKPALGIFESDGTKDTNIVHTGNGTHAFVPFRDTNPNCKPSEIYKAIASGGFNNQPALLGFVSEDGYRWKAISDKPLMTDGKFDSQNLAFWDQNEQQYVCYFRDFRDGIRDVKRATSKDFTNWTKGEWLSYTGAPHEQLYTNTIQPYPREPSLYVSFPKRFMADRRLFSNHPYMGISDGVFMSSRNGKSFHLWKEAFVRPGPDQDNWTDRSTMAAWGIQQLSLKEISIYYSRDYQHPTSHIARMVIRTDGFTSIHANGDKGTVRTKPVIFKGQSLSVNFATSAGGTLRAAVLNENGRPLPGYSLDDCPDMYGDDIQREVKWKSGADLSKLAGQPVRLLFELTDADLYSFQFQ